MGAELHRVSFNW